MVDTTSLKLTVMRTFPRSTRTPRIQATTTRPCFSFKPPPRPPPRLLNALPFPSLSTHAFNKGKAIDVGSFRIVFRIRVGDAFDGDVRIIERS